MKYLDFLHVEKNLQKLKVYLKFLCGLVQNQCGQSGRRTGKFSVFLKNEMVE